MYCIDTIYCYKSIQFIVIKN